MKKFMTISMLAASLTALAAHDMSSIGVNVKQPVDPATEIRVAEGFSAKVFATDLGNLRHMVVHKSGWVFATLWRPKDGKGAVGMKDTDGDGSADKFVYFAKDLFGTGMTLSGNKLYAGFNEKIMRYSLSDEGAIESADVIVDGLIKHRSHNAKTVTLDGEGGLYVNFGAPSNACMVQSRTKGSPGQMPCEQLQQFGGIWKFDADKVGQTKADGTLYVTGIRNAVAMEWHPDHGEIYLVNHGRDQLHSFFPQYYSADDSAELPAEEFHRATAGDDLGWPYSYFDPRTGKRIVMPEYGGDGQKIDTKGKTPLYGFPAHWAPNDLIFPSPATGLPTGILVAFHGSWNRGTKQRGYRVTFTPLDGDGNLAGPWVTFADGFANPAAGTGEAVNEVQSPRDAKSRPMSLAEGPNGEIYIASFKGGKVWVVTHDQ